jgi:hypothetical protein
MRSVVTLNVVTLSFVILSVIILSVIILSVVILSAIILSVFILSVVILSVIILSFIILTVIILNVIILSVIILSVIILSVIILSFVIPSIVRLYLFPTLIKSMVTNFNEGYLKGSCLFLSESTKAKNLNVVWAEFSILDLAIFRVKFGEIQLPVSATRWLHDSQICFATFIQRNITKLLKTQQPLMLEKK